ncbi:MAG: hypothetical protein ACREUW_15115 [Burkholderiales bacterium]
MPSVARIRTLGFRRWYERQLLESHAYLVTGFLSLVALFAGVEQVGGSAGWRLFGALGVSVFAGMVCFGAFRRYLLMLAYAEHVASHRRCEACGTGAAEMLDAGGQREGSEEGWLKLRCRHCSHQWLIE